MRIFFVWFSFSDRLFTRKIKFICVSTLIFSVLCVFFLPTAEHVFVQFFDDDINFFSATLYFSSCYYPEYTFILTTHIIVITLDTYWRLGVVVRHGKHASTQLLDLGKLWTSVWTCWTKFHTFFSLFPTLKSLELRSLMKITNDGATRIMSRKWY